MSLFSFLQTRKANRGVTGDLFEADAFRLNNYGRFMRSYEGYSVKGPPGTAVVSDYKRLKFNFNKPIVNLGAGFLAGKPLQWEVEDNPDATEMAHTIWDRSGSDGAFLEAAIACGIHGDIVAVVAQDEDGLPKIEFVDAGIAFPQFARSDYSKLVALDIAYETLDSNGQRTIMREFYTDDHMEVYQGDTRISSQTYNAMPAVWIRNICVKGRTYGLSDIDGVVDLVEEYDHLASKQTRIVDYYAAPVPVFKGIQAPAKGIDKSLQTSYFLPTDGDAFFLERKGEQPDVENQLTRVRNAIAEVSQVPAVAFGQSDSGLTSISGIALQILYGPLINKTQIKQASWTPGLEYAMWVALTASGYNVPLGSVNVKWPSTLPVDGSAEVTDATTKVAGDLNAIRTAMANIGVEDPNGELRKILVEKKLLALAGASDPTDQAAGGQGPQPGQPGQQPAQGAGAAPTPVDNVASVEQMLSDFDAIVATEEKQSDTGGRPAPLADIKTRYAQVIAARRTRVT